MKIDIKPYKSFGPLVFGRSSKSDCIQLLGQPIRTQTNREGVEELHYDKFIIRLDPSTHTVWECTLLPRTTATIDGFKVTWDKDFLRRVCEHDGSPRDSVGFIVVPRLGIAVTGIHDDDESQMAVTVFSNAELDTWLNDAVPFELHSLK